MVLPPVDIAQYHSQIFELRPSPEPGQQMSPRLVLVTLPAGYIMIGIARILVRTAKDKRMQTHFQSNLPDRIESQFWLNPQARQ